MDFTWLLFFLSASCSLRFRSASGAIALFDRARFGIQQPFSGQHELLQLWHSSSFMWEITVGRGLQSCWSSSTSFFGLVLWRETLDCIVNHGLNFKPSTEVLRTNQLTSLGPQSGLHLDIDVENIICSNIHANAKTYTNKRDRHNAKKHRALLSGDGRRDLQSGFVLS